MSKYINIVENCLDIEAKAIIDAKKQLLDSDLQKIADIFEFLRQTRGSLIFCGVGKSGLVAAKLASTFSSLALPSFFLHPNEALHGDLGRVTEADAIVWISNSGTTEEIVKLLPFVKIPKERMIGILGNPNSEIGNICNVVLNASVEKEACLNNLAPTTSTTLAMALGDAMAVMFEYQSELSKEKFAENHPGGLLGKSLSLKTKNLYVTKNQCAIVDETATLKDVILSMTTFNTGGCAVLGKDDQFLGLIVEGDIRRTLAGENYQLDIKVKDIMNTNPKSIGPSDLAAKALDIMEGDGRQISILPVLEGQQFLGFLRIHDLFQAGLTKKKA